MNYFKISVFSILLFLTIQDKQFVKFISDEVEITENQEHVTLVLPFEILNDFHIQSEHVEDSNFIATEIHFDPREEFDILGYQFTKTQRDNLVLDQLKCEVLSNRLEVTVQLEKNFTSNKPLYLTGHLYYQACDDRQCFYPRTLQFVVKQSIN